MECNCIDKKSVRRWVKNQKAQMTQADIALQSQCIMEKLMAMPEYDGLENLFIYVNFNEEVVTTKLIEESLRKGKRVFVPKIFGDEEKYMEFLEIKSLSDLEEGYYGISEPKGEVENATRLRKGLLVMPGLAFDREFHRIGYGGGFYDRYLSPKHEFFTVAVGFDFQLMDLIPYEEFDLQPQVIVTNQELLRHAQ